MGTQCPSCPAPSNSPRTPPHHPHWSALAGRGWNPLTQQSQSPGRLCPLCPAQQWLWHSHHPVQAPGQQLAAPPQRLPHAQGLVSSTHGTLQGKGHCQGLCQAQGAASTLPWHTHPPWLHCSRPPRPPWARTWGTPAPLQRQGRVGVFVTSWGLWAAATHQINPGDTQDFSLSAGGSVKPSEIFWEHG